MHRRECVTLYPSCWPASPVKSTSAARGPSQAAGPWPEHGTPHRGSRPARSPRLDSDSNSYFPLTSGLRPEGSWKETDHHLETLPVRGRNSHQTITEHVHKGQEPVQTTHYITLTLNEDTQYWQNSYICLWSDVSLHQLLFLFILKAEHDPSGLWWLIYLSFNHSQCSS